MRVDGDREVGRIEQHAAVGLRVLDVLTGKARGSARLVLDQDGGSVRQPQPLGEDAPRHVSAAAGRKADDDPHRALLRLRQRARNSAQNRRDDACGGGAEHMAACQHARSSEQVGQAPPAFANNKSTALAHCRFVRGSMIAGYRNSGSGSTTASALGRLGAGAVGTWAALRFLILQRHLTLFLYMTIVRTPRPNRGGALEALKCGDDRSGALEMRRVDSGIGAATSAAIGAVALDGLATRPWRPKPCCPDVATANQGLAAGRSAPPSADVPVISRSGGKTLAPKGCV